MSGKIFWPMCFCLHTMLFFHLNTVGVCLVRFLLAHHQYGLIYCTRTPSRGARWTPRITPNGLQIDTPNGGSWYRIFDLISCRVGFMVHDSSCYTWLPFCSHPTSVQRELTLNALQHPLPKTHMAPRCWHPNHQTAFFRSLPLQWFSGSSQVSFRVALWSGTLGREFFHPLGSFERPSTRCERDVRSVPDTQLTCRRAGGQCPPVRSPVYYNTSVHVSALCL